MNQMEIVYLSLGCYRGFPGRSVGKESACSPWVRKIPWRRKWQTTPVFLPAEFYGHRNLVGYSPWGHKESDMTNQINHHQFIIILKFFWHFFMKHFRSGSLLAFLHFFFMGMVLITVSCTMSQTSIRYFVYHI